MEVRDPLNGVFEGIILIEMSSRILKNRLKDKFVKQVYSFQVKWIGVTFYPIYDLQF